jgi:hypothetical protein
MEVSRNIFSHFIGYYLALQYSGVLNLNNIQESRIQTRCSIFVSKQK